MNILGTQDMGFDGYITGVLGQSASSSRLLETCLQSGKINLNHPAAVRKTDSKKGIHWLGRSSRRSQLVPSRSIPTAIWFSKWQE